MTLRALFVVAGLVLSACATTTPREKIVTGTTQIAFGAPMLLGGIVGGAADGVALVASQAAFASANQQNPAFLPELGALALALAWAGAGGFLIVAGQGNLEGGLAAWRDPDAQAALLRREREEEAARVRKRKPAQQLQEGWAPLRPAPQDQDDGGPSRVVQPEEPKP